MTIQTKYEFEDGELPYWSIEIIGFMSPEGNSSWAYVQTGEADLNEKIALLERIKHRLIRADDTETDI